MKTCNNYKDIVNKREIDRTPQENNNVNIYNRWVQEIEKDCNGKAMDEEEYFDRIFKDSSKYCLV